MCTASYFASHFIISDTHSNECTHICEDVLAGENVIPLLSDLIYSFELRVGVVGERRLLLVDFAIAPAKK